MTVSQPSKEIYSIDIPDIQRFIPEFVYNFFTKDESINESGNVPTSVLERNSTAIDASFIQYATVRAPRFVKFTWKPVSVLSTGRQSSSDAIRSDSFEINQQQGVLSENIDKVITEDKFASYDFIGVNFHDSKIDEKIHYLVSGSYEQHTLGQENSKNLTLSKSSKLLKSILPRLPGLDLVTRGLSSPQLSTGTKFTVIESTVKKQQLSTSPTVHQSTIKSNRKRLLLVPKFFEKLKSVNINTQINSKFLSDLTDKAIIDPSNTLSTDISSLQSFAKNIQRYVKDKGSSSISESDFQTNVPFIDLNITKASHFSQNQQVKIVGYLIDKTEILKDGSAKNHPSIIAEGVNVSIAVDFQVKYGSTYKYSIRSVAKLTMPAIDIDTGDIASLTVLVSSRPSTPVIIDAVESVAPPAPSNLNFVWNYELNKLMLVWNFPTNLQQDIKKFQIFRRKTITQPYELVKMYDFNDSIIRIPDKENPNSSLIEYLSSPSTTFIDDDFTMDSKFIYAVAAIDAHGLTSNYSEQFEVTFDRFKNRLKKILISHSGAPKPYPNLYLEKDMFVDTIRVDGPSSKRMKIYLNPEHYKVLDDEGRIKTELQTNQIKGSYIIQFINVDNQKSETLNISIDDRSTKFNNDIVNIAKKSYFGKRLKLNSKKSV